MLTISALAKAAGLSRSTLLYYDRLGLLKPSGRSRTGYRQYSPSDRERLALICPYRQMGIPLKEMKKLQDHLGDLQDAVVASELLRDFLTWGTWGHAEGKKQAALPSEPIVAPGVATYMADKQRELQHLLSTFPEVWGYFQSREFKQAVAGVVAPL